MTTAAAGTLTASVSATLGDNAADPITISGHGTNAAFLIGRQVITASGTYTPTSGTYKVLLQQCGGGGGGGGVESGTNPAGGGGAAGSYQEKWIDPGAAITGGTVTIGAAGTGVSGADGNSGGFTEITIQGTTYRARGGLGGLEAVNGGYGGADNTINNVGTVDLQFGSNGFSSASTGNGVVVSGRGADSRFGGGGIGRTATDGAGAGSTGFGYCSGGGGAWTDSGAQAGGAGTAGVSIIWEYR